MTAHGPGWDPGGEVEGGGQKLSEPLVIGGKQTHMHADEHTQGLVGRALEEHNTRGQRLETKRHPGRVEKGGNVAARLET